jgi:hypothetical protein
MADPEVTTKLRVRIGEVEVDYEGTDTFLRSELPALLTTVLELHAKTAQASAKEEVHSEKRPKAPRQSGNAPVSASTAATKMGCRSGSDLALAAAAALVIGEGKDSFSRSDLLESMRAAKAHYKASYANNLSKYLTTLVKSGDLLDHGGDKYGLQDSKRTELEQKLG